MQNPESKQPPLPSDVEVTARPELGGPDGLHPPPLLPLQGRPELGAAPGDGAQGLHGPEKHPFFEFGEVEFFLARRDGQVVGRIAAVSNPRYNEFHEHQRRLLRPLRVRE